jgi:MoaA/NifB/PqqE/SkfB family radical SAM enzyme
MSGFSKHIDQMSLETVAKVLKKYGQRWIDWFNWGEPLLHKDFQTIADMVHHTPSRISTNLSHHLRDKDFEALNKFRVVLVSLSGMTEDIYGIYHQGGNFDLVMKNLDTLVRSRRKPMVMNWLTHPYNTHQFNQAREFCEKWGMKFNPTALVCTVQELVEGFDHELLQVPKFKKTGRLRCRILDWIPIATDGSYLLCCASQNVKIGYKIDDDVSEEELVKARMGTELCQTCREGEYWRMWS